MGWPTNRTRHTGPVTGSSTVDNATPDVDRVLDELRAGGHRVTAARRAVITALAEVDTHPTVEQIATRVEERWPGLHLSTIYRTLETLAELGVVSHVHLGHGTAYHLTRPAHGSSHLHAQCRACQRVLDLPGDLLEGVRDHLRALTGFDLDPHHVALSGLCRECAGPAATSTAPGRRSP